VNIVDKYIDYYELQQIPVDIITTQHLLSYPLNDWYKYVTYINHHCNLHNHFIRPQNVGPNFKSHNEVRRAGHARLINRSYCSPKL